MVVIANIETPGITEAGHESIEWDDVIKRCAHGAVDSGETFLVGENATRAGLSYKGKSWIELVFQSFVKVLIIESNTRTRLDGISNIHNHHIKFALVLLQIFLSIINDKLKASIVINPGNIPFGLTFFCRDLRPHHQYQP